MSRAFLASAAAGLGLLAAVAAQPAAAKPGGCVKGAAVGGVAGHFAGHHAVLGAMAGCAVGVHTRHKAEHEKAAAHGGDAPATH